MSLASAEMARKRSVLFAARLKFSPETQPIRETAIDKIVEQNMLVADDPMGLSVTDIINQGAICFANGTPVLSQKDVEESLERLSEAGRLERKGKGRDSTYKLSNDARADLDAAQTIAESRFSRVLAKLFGETGVDHQRYSAPFLECLCVIFSKLGDMFVKSLKGDIAPNTLHQVPSVMEVLARIPTKYPDLDSALFTRAIVSFFRDTDPEYDLIKWNLGQNYYIARALGLDQGGTLLSREVFGGTAVYLDTNVIIQAVEPSARHNKSISSLCQACKHLGITLNVCQISLDEMRRVVSYWREILPKVADQIPEKTVPKIRDFVFQLYRERMTSDGTVDLDALLASFDDPMAALRTRYDVELIDDVWFEKAERDNVTRQLSERIIKESLSKKKKPKNERSGTHDALLLRWVDQESATTGRKNWIVTLDMRLPSSISASQKGRPWPLAITLTAFLQWISPMALSHDSDDDLARIFSEAISYQLLPQDTFFDIRDFLVFAELEWSCKQLPAEDVENCIRYLKMSTPGLDLSDAGDREKATSVISKFFADPSRKYKQELSQMEHDALTMTQEHVAKEESLQRQVVSAQNEISKLQEEVGKTARDAKFEIEKLKLRNSAYVRLLWSLVVLAALETIASYFALAYGEGSNAFQKLLHSWEVLGLAFALSVATAWFIIGKERLKLLGWPFRKILKGKE